MRTFGYRYGDSFTEEDFRNEVFQFLKDSILVPTYIFDEMEYTKVGRINIPLIIADGTATINYSRKLGFDRYETTTKVKTTTYGNGYQNRTQTSSTRTITDWRYDEGTLTGDASAGTYDEKYRSYDEYVTNHVMDKNNIIQIEPNEYAPYEATEEMLNNIKNDILNKVYSENITYPADHVKNEEYYGDVTLHNITYTIVSLYSMVISIRDKQILFYACSNGQIEMKYYGDFPFDDDWQQELDTVGEINRERSQETKKPRLIYIFSFLIGIALFITLLVLGIQNNLIALNILSAVPLLIGFFFGIKYFRITSKINRAYSKRVIDYRMNLENKRQEIKNESYESFIQKL